MSPTHSPSLGRSAPGSKTGRPCSSRPPTWTGPSGRAPSSTSITSIAACSRPARSASRWSGRASCRSRSNPSSTASICWRRRSPPLGDNHRGQSPPLGDSHWGQSPVTVPPSAISAIESAATVASTRSTGSSTHGGAGSAAVTPTRNRADLAIGAARSLLAQDVPIDIFLCDNSSSPDALGDYCRGEPRVHYLRPPSEASMPENWDFAVRSAMERSAATHFTIHYDRKISKPGFASRLAHLAGRWPDELLSFPSDFITDQPPPLRVWQPPWTGLPFSIDTRHVAGLLAQGHVSSISHALPVLSNCLVPRAMLGEVVGNFGDVCNSSGPDSAFMWRFFALRDRYIHFDRPVGIFYASHRSTGLGYLRGRGGDFADYVKTFGDKPWLDAAPIPGV